MGDKGRQDPREGGHTIQQRETRRGAMGDKGDKTLGKADTNKKGIEGVQWETRRDKTLGNVDTPSNKGKQEGVQWETKGGTMGDKGRQDPREGGHTIQQRETRRGTMGDKGRQDPREGGHTIQHQGGHLKIALRTPNSTLFGEKCVTSFFSVSSTTLR